VDPFSLLLLAQTAVGAITAGCEMLREGKAIIDDFKGEAEGVVGQINEAKEQAFELWETIVGLKDWALGLLGSVTKLDGGASPKKVNDINVADTTKSVTEAPKPVAKKAKQKQQELTYEEYQARAVHDICENLKVYFEAIRQLKAHCRELEEESLTTEKVADSAIDRIEIQWQMNQLSAQLKQAMIYGTPRELGLGAMYEDFLIKYDEIVEAQEVAATLKFKKERDNKWQRELLKHHRIDRALAGIAVLVMVLWMWGIVLSLGWLVKTPGGLLRVLSS
jgi:hypothetical protein